MRSEMSFCSNWANDSRMFKVNGEGAEASYLAKRTDTALYPRAFYAGRSSRESRRWGH